MLKREAVSAHNFSGVISIKIANDCNEYLTGEYALIRRNDLGIGETAFILLKVSWHFRTGRYMISKIEFSAT